MMIEDGWVIIHGKDKWRKMSMKLRAKVIDKRINNYKTFPYYEHDDIEIYDLDWSRDKYRNNNINIIKYDILSFFNQVEIELIDAFKVFVDTM